MPIDMLNTISVFPVKLEQMLPITSLSPAGLSRGPGERLLVLGGSRRRCLLEAGPAARPSVRISHTRLSGESDAVPQPQRPSQAGSAAPGCGCRVATPACSEEEGDGRFLNLVLMHWED